MLCGEYVHSEYSMSACLFCIHECNKVAAPPNSEWKALACAQKKSVFLNTAAAADTALWNTHGNVDNAAFITFLRPSVDKQSWRSWVGAECRKAKMKNPLSNVKFGRYGWTYKNISRTHAWKYTASLPFCFGGDILGSFFWFWNPFYLVTRNLVGRAITRRPTKKVWRNHGNRPFWAFRPFPPRWRLRGVFKGAHPWFVSVSFMKFVWCVFHE